PRSEMPAPGFNASSMAFPGYRPPLVLFTFPHSHAIQSSVAPVPRRRKGFAPAFAGTKLKRRTSKEAEVRMARTAVSGAELKKSAEQASRNGSGPGLPPEKLLEIYRLMVLSRRTDDREIILKNQQKVFFQISGAGHEALLVTAGLSLRPGYDWFFPYYRDRGLSLALGTTVEEQFLQAVGASNDIASGGRQMPSHWSNTRLHIVTPSSSTATQCLQAV